MLKLDVKKLVAAVQTAASYSLPEMNKGTRYLHDSVFSRMKDGEVVRISELDFSAFESDDIGSFVKIYRDTYEHNATRTNGIVSTLMQINPACKETPYV